MRLIKLLVIAVAMISRRKRCRRDPLGEALLYRRRKIPVKFGG